MSFSPVPSYIFGTMFSGLGLLCMFAPKTDYDVYGLPLEAATGSGPASRSTLSSTSTSTGSVSPLIYAKGARDLAFGLTYFALEYRGLSDAVTIFSGVLCAVALIDGIVVWMYGGDKYKHKAFGHWGGLVPFVGWVFWRLQNS